MLATQKDMIQLDDNLTKMRATQTDLVVKMTDLSSNLEALNSQLDSSQQRMTALSQKLDDLQADIQRRMSLLAGQMGGGAPSGATQTSNPSDIYRLAFNDYQAGKFDLALIGFRNFVSQYPHTDLASQAQFQVGECRNSPARIHLDAAREYDKTVQMAPKADLAAKALYKKGVALHGRRVRDNDARDTFRRVIKGLPAFRRREIPPKTFSNRSKP